MSDLQQLMLGMMAGGQEAVDARATVMRMLSEQQDGMDPTTQALLSRVLEPAAEPAAAPDGDDGDEDDGDGHDHAERRQRALRRLRDRFDAMQAELDELRERQDAVAAALGACAECWGEDPHCALCGGRGTPGRFLPDRRLYRMLVGPANRAVRAARRARGSIPRASLATGGVT